MKTYSKYPVLAEIVRKMNPECREAVALWHRVNAEGFESFRLRYRFEMSNSTIAERTSAMGALETWSGVLAGIAAVLMDPSEGEWCCLHGMHAYPRPCPQHAPACADPRSEAVGCVLLSADGDRVVKMTDNSEDPHPWFAMDSYLRYRDSEVEGWRLIYRIPPVMSF